MIIGIISLAILYLFLSLFLLWGIVHHKHKICSHQPPVTVIVAARNEARHILNCLNSLARLKYPPARLEIIIINDRSTDNTGTIITQFIENHPDFKYMEIVEDHPSLSGKAGAISKAIEKCYGEFIFITDADCTVPETWLLETVPHFLEDVGVVAGFTFIQSSDSSSSLFEKVQAMDWLYLLTLAAGAAGWNMPVSCVGNNFAFRKKAYQDIGGYEGVGFSLTEDFALLSAIDRATEYRVVFPINDRNLVLSEPLDNIASFFRQRIRWAVGGFKVRLFGKLLISIGLLTHLGLLTIPFLDLNYVVSLVPILLLIIADLAVIVYASKKLHLLPQVVYYPLFKAFYLIYLLVIPLFTFTKRKITWKDISYPIIKK